MFIKCASNFSNEMYNFHGKHLVLRTLNPSGGNPHPHVNENEQENGQTLNVKQATSNFDRTSLGNPLHPNPIHIKSHARDRFNQLNGIVKLVVPCRKKFSSSWLYSGQYKKKHIWTIFEDDKLYRK